MLERLERITQPTEAQRAAFDSLKNATARASEMARAACPTERPITPPGRLADAEKRLEALLQAVRTVRPAMDSFYGSLTDEQKARLLIGQARWSWGGRHERREAGGQGDPGTTACSTKIAVSGAISAQAAGVVRRIIGPAAAGAMAVTAKTCRGATMIATPGRTAVVRPRLLPTSERRRFVSNPRPARASVPRSAGPPACRRHLSLRRG